MTTCVQTQKELREEVSGLLHWTEEEYFNYVLDQGLYFLHLYCGSDQPAIEHCRQSPEFWKWWRSQWLLRDQVYADHFNEEWIQHCHRLSMYHDLHNPKALVAELTIPRLVFKTLPVITFKL